MLDIDLNVQKSSVQALMDRMRRDGSAFFETLHLTKDGREIPVEISARLIEYLNRPAVLAIARDVSERKLTEEALATVMQSLEELESIVSASPAIVFRWTYSNERYVQFVTDNVMQFGYHPSDLISSSRPYSEFIHRDDQARVASEIARYDEDNVTEYGLEYRIVTRDGPTRWVDDRTTVRVAEAGMPMIHQGIVMDISPRKEAERALRLANEKLNLMGTITRHDVANQLSIVLGALALIDEDADEAARKRHMEMARDAIKIVSQQLEFAGSYQKAGSKAPEWVHVRLDLLSAIASLDLGGVSVEHKLGDLEIWADTMFEKVLLNLIDNSVRHGGDVTKIKVHAHKRGDELALVIEDNGSGIKPEDKDLIFQRGYGQHTGLGLFLCREILAITGLRIEETGDYGKGTRFEITAPPDRFRNMQ
jgi:PAS domain S-box-containing protein